MRRILVDHARARNAAKREAGRRVAFEPHELAESLADARIEALDEALTRLAAQQPRMAELVELRRFGGLTLDECAAALNISPRTADAWWAYARAWLAVELDDS